jgi:hypothetical protein
MQGADLAAVQPILRHSDPKLTIEVYAHLAPEYLRAEVDRLSFGPAVTGTVPDGDRPLTPTLSPAARGRGRDAFATPLLRTPPTGKEKAGTRGDQATGFRPSELERETGFEPATLSLGS